MDMHLTPYRVVATGYESGMIEVVLNAETTANIQKVSSPPQNAPESPN